MEERKPRVRVAGILIKDNEVLLIEHTKGEKQYWLIPGGGIDWGEGINEALIREYKEETNIDIKINKFLFISETISPDLERHVINLYFSVEQIGGELKLGKEEILTNLKYFKVQDLEDIKLYPNVKQDVIKFIKNENDKVYLGKIWDN